MCSQSQFKQIVQLTIKDNELCMLIFVSNLYSSPLCFLHRNKFVLFHLAKCVRSFLTASAILCTSEGTEIKQWILSVTVMEACLIKKETYKDLVCAFSASYPLPLCYKILILCLSKRFWSWTRVPVQFDSFFYLVVQSGSQIWDVPHWHPVSPYWGCLHCSRSLDPFFGIFTLESTSFICSESTSRIKAVTPSRSHRYHQSAEVTTDSLSHLQSAEECLMEHVQKEQSSFQPIILFAAEHREEFSLPRKHRANVWPPHY